MYDPVKTLQAIDDNTLPILVMCTLAMLCNYAWFFAAYRQAQRDRVYAVPLFCCFFWLVADATVVLNFDRAFNTYDHWYPKLFWVALLFTVAFEIAFIRQAIRYGRDELLPSWTHGQFAALILGGVGAAGAIWYVIQQSIRDDLFITYFHIANTAMPLFYAGLLIRRRSTAGTSKFIWQAYLAMETFWYLASMLWFGDDVRGPETALMWAVTTIGCIGMLVAIGRLPDASGARLPTAGRPERRSRAESPVTVG